MRVNTLASMALATAFSSIVLSGCADTRDPAAKTLSATNAETALRSIAYVGADRCGGCHEIAHNGWEQTAHAQILRDGLLEGSYINDGDGSDRADFFDLAELDLVGYEDFADFEEHAPVLGSDITGPYIVLTEIVLDDEGLEVQQSKKYYITHTLGGSPHANRTDADLNEDGLVLNGEAQWKQTYLTKIGNHHYILPVQFNAQDGEYVSFQTEDWYNVLDPDDNPDGDNAPINVATSQSYERLCAGCHVTGLAVSVSEENEWSMTFTDPGVACEACHGPGGMHVTYPTDDNILNPADMVAYEDLNGDAVIDEIDHLIIRNMVCYSCHSRGEGNFEDSTEFKPAYSGRPDGKGNLLTYMPGLNLGYYLSVSYDEDLHWFDAPLSEGGKFVASKNQNQQTQDFIVGPHAPDKSYDNSCFVCHDMHTPTKHMVTPAIDEDGITVVTENDNNTLCLACHVGHGDFADLNVATLNLLTAGDEGAEEDVEEAVLVHMEKALMGGVSYDPAGTEGVGRCSTCHMPKTGVSAARDENGMGDLHNHSFEIIWPSKNEKADALAELPNSCNGCHNEDDVESGTDQITAWAKSGHGDENGDPWLHYDWDGNDTDPPSVDRQDCQRCHTATGAHNYMTALADDVAYDPAANEFNLGVGENQVLYCYGCHTGNGGELNNPGAITANYADAPEDYPDVLGSNVCMACHVGQASGGSIANSTAEFSNLSFINSHYLTAGGTLFTLTGYEYDVDSDPDTDDYANDEVDYLHDNVGEVTNGPCIGCHLSSPEPDSHLFLPVTEIEDGVVTAITGTVCDDCHGDVAESLSPAFIEEQKMGLVDLLEALRAALAEDGFVFAVNYPYFFNTVDNSFANAVSDWAKGEGDTIGKHNMGAAFNYNLILHDPGAYAHNSLYAKRLVFDAIDWLDRHELGGIIDLSAYPDAAEYLQDDGDDTNDDVVNRP